MPKSFVNLKGKRIDEIDIFFKKKDYIFPSC